MRAWTQIVNYVRSLIGRSPVDTDLGDELRGYLDMLADEKMAAGMPEADAYRAARLEMGGVDQVAERVRDVRPAAWLDTLVRDARHGAAQIARAPLFSGAVIVVLTLGIGANVAVFDLVNLLLLKPRVAVVDPDGLVALHVQERQRPGSFHRFSYADFDALRSERALFRDVAAHRRTRVVLSDDAGSRTAQACTISASFFPTLGAGLALGRNFTEDEERPGSGAAVAIIGHATWQELGGDRSVLGRTITINTHAFSVVGVAPEGFTGTMAAFAPAVWMPLGAEVLLGGRDDEHQAAGIDEIRDAHSLGLVARTTTSPSLERLNADLRQLSARVRLRSRGAMGDEVVSANALARTEDSETPEDDSGLYVPMAALAGMAALLLVVAGLNAANMLLARGTTRRKEIATRLALGAGRGRIVAQLLVENLLLTFAAGAAGLGLGTWAVTLVGASFAPLVDDVLVLSGAPDARVLAATAAYCLLSALVCAVGPALRLSKLSVVDDLKGRGESNARGRGSRIGPRHLLVAWQVALSLALLATAGLFVRAAVIAGEAEPGYPLDRQLLVVTDASGQSARRAGDGFAALVDALRTVPGVDAASPASLVAFGNHHQAGLVAASASPAHAVSAQRFAVGTDYFRTLGLALLRGREFSSAEERAGGSPAIAIIDAPLARELFGGADPVGQYIEFPGSESGRPATRLLVVGLAAGQRDRLTDRSPVAHVYVPYGTHMDRRANVHLRLSESAWADRASLIRRVAAITRSDAPDLAVLGVSTLAEARDRVPANWLIRTAGVVFGYLGLVGLAMAVAGLYGVKSYLVACRTREFGIRMALGATPGRVVSLVLREGTVSLAIGVAVGFVLALGAGRLVSRLVVGVHPLDPAVFAVATASLVASIGLASYLPARRATKVDPGLAFRSE